MSDGAQCVRVEVTKADDCAVNVLETELMGARQDSTIDGSLRYLRVHKLRDRKVRRLVVVGAEYVVPEVPLRMAASARDAR